MEVPIRIDDDFTIDVIEADEETKETDSNEGYHKDCYNNEFSLVNNIEIKQECDSDIEENYLEVDSRFISLLQIKTELESDEEEEEEELLTLESITTELQSQLNQSHELNTNTEGTDQNQNKHFDNNQQHINVGSEKSSIETAPFVQEPKLLELSYDKEAVKEAKAFCIDKNGTNIVEISAAAEEKVGHIATETKVKEAKIPSVISNVSSDPAEKTNVIKVSSVQDQKRVCENSPPKFKRTTYSSGKGVDSPKSFWSKEKKHSSFTPASNWEYNRQARPFRRKSWYRGKKCANDHAGDNLMAPCTSSSHRSRGSHHYRPVTYNFNRYARYNNSWPNEFSSNISNRPPSGTFSSPQGVHNWQLYSAILSALNQLNQPSPNFTSNGVTFESRSSSYGQFNNFYNVQNNGWRRRSIKRSQVWKNAFGTDQVGANDCMNSPSLESFNFTLNSSTVQLYRSVLCAINQINGSLVYNNDESYSSSTNSMSLSMSFFNLCQQY